MNINKYLPAILVILLLTCIVMNGEIISRLPKSSSPSSASDHFGAAAPVAPPAEGGPAAASTAVQTPVADPDVTVIGIQLQLAGTVAQSAARADLATASSWLSSNGFTVTATATDTITFSGTAGDIQTAFGNRIGKYTANGATCYSGVPAGNTIITVPAKLASIVGAITLPGGCTGA